VQHLGVRWGLLACVITLVILRFARPGFGRLMAGQHIQGRQRLALSGYQVLPLREVPSVTQPIATSHTTDNTLQSNNSSHTSGLRE
jgi:hypothetical protein